MNELGKKSLRHDCDSERENNGVLFSEGHPHFSYQMPRGGIFIAVPNFLSSHISA